MTAFDLGLVLGVLLQCVAREHQALKLNEAIINVINCSCAFPAMTIQNVRCETSPLGNVPQRAINK